MKHEIVLKLKDHASANCKVLIEENGDKITLISYRTQVIIAHRIINPTDNMEFIKTDEYYICCTGLYSRTTCKHIGWFLKEYFPEINFYNISDCIVYDNICISTISKYAQANINEVVG